MVNEILASAIERAFEDPGLDALYGANLIRGFFRLINREATSLSLAASGVERQ